MKEFILLMAYLNALVALSIDAMLPALGLMGSDLGVVRANDMQFVIGFIFIGMTLGQICYGPLADSMGRKRALHTGLLLYIAGSVLCWWAHSLPMMLMGRFLQGVGVSAPRIISVAIVRDQYQGRDMAYIMSMVMGVFIMVPAIAPTLGQGIIHLAGWREIFLFYILAAVAGFFWFHMRQVETLSPAHRRPFRLHDIGRGYKEAACHPITRGYMLCGGLSFGALLGYLTCSQQIFHELFLAGDRFALYFGLLALCIGAAFFSNSALVRKHGMRRITRISIYVLTVASALFLAYTLLMPPSLLIFMLFVGVAFFSLGLMFGNMNAMAMEPMGHMAGLASAFVGAGSSAVSLMLGSLIGQLYNGTLLPLAAGFMLLSLATWFTMWRTEVNH